MNRSESAKSSVSLPSWLALVYFWNALCNVIMPLLMQYRILVRSDNLQRSHKRMKALQRLHVTGDIRLEELVQRIRTWEAHLLHGDPCRLRRKLFDHYVFVKGEEAYIKLLAEEERMQAYEEE